MVQGKVIILQCVPCQVPRGLQVDGQERSARLEHPCQEPKVMVDAVDSHFLKRRHVETEIHALAGDSLNLGRQQEPDLRLGARLVRFDLMRQGHAEVGKHALQETVAEQHRFRQIDDGRAQGRIQAAVKRHVHAGPGADFQHRGRQRPFLPQDIGLQAAEIGIGVPGIPMRMFGADPHLGIEPPEPGLKRSHLAPLPDALGFLPPTRHPTRAATAAAVPWDQPPPPSRRERHGHPAAAASPTKIR